jgi:glycosyltransferase involved in cell wall biosynthesis
MARRIDSRRIALLRGTALFDSKWYLQHAPDVATSGQDPIEHYLRTGWAEGRNPCSFFNSSWYLSVNVDVLSAGVNPLLHYIDAGEAEGRWPCRIFDPSWYARNYGVSRGNGDALTHYLTIGCYEYLQPNEIFDPLFYKQYHTDLKHADVDPALHYLERGYQQQRHAARGFSLEWYRRTYLEGDRSIDPVHHYLTLGKTRGLRRAAQTSIANEIRNFSKPGPEFEELDAGLTPKGALQAKLIAFYLPQFHSIPENDAWWGRGFTEWRNTQRGVPRFQGHHQPRVPRDLGFYDLSNPEIMKRQIDLARVAGLSGFCFYYYYFNGKRLLEIPTEQFLSDSSVYFPFCLMWANENWTRRWDGAEVEVLLRQHYRIEDEDLLLADWSRHFDDPRYIRADGRPLMLIYRPDIIPDVVRTVERWRRKLSENYSHNPWFLMSQSFGNTDPRKFGFDAAFEFPPHKFTQGSSLCNDQLHLLDSDFSGQVFSYDHLVEKSLAEPPSEFPLIKTLCPSWDNDARRQGKGLTVHGSSPAKYERWLSRLVSHARAHPLAGEPLLFVNAWNEWAEAAYLEPDVYYGSAYLNATARALARRDALLVEQRALASRDALGVEQRALPSRDALVDEPPSILLVGHDALSYGAQINFLNMGRILVHRFGMRITWLLLEGGPLLESYRETGPVIVGKPGSEEVQEALVKLRANGFRYAITNTLVTGKIVAPLNKSGFRTLSLVHELPKLAAQYGLQESAAVIANGSDVIVFGADMVARGFRKFCGAAKGSTYILPQGLYASVRIDSGSRDSVRRGQGIPADARIVLGLGSADLRKGIDLFLSAASAAAERDLNLYFIWVGHADPVAQLWLMPQDRPSAIPSNFRYLEFLDDVAPFLNAADALFLSSREDPFPSVVLEAFAYGLPVVGFEGCSGTEELIRKHGEIVPAFDIAAAVEALRTQVVDNNKVKSAVRMECVSRDFRYDKYCSKLIELLNPLWRPVSVVVPNYNYARYLRQRLESIFSQSMPVFEIIVLDDASTDDSLSVLEQIRLESKRDFLVYSNTYNSGSAVRQWLNGLQHASSDLVWIAEADDLARPTFLERLVTAFDRDRTLFAFCDSAQIDSNGIVKGDSYLDYFRQSGAAALSRNLAIEARTFANRFLMVRNLILNVSSLVARRHVFLEALSSSIGDLERYSFAADWHLYGLVCQLDGDVRYIAEALNIHRRHGLSATHIVKKEAHIAEIEKLHKFLENAFGIDEAFRLLRVEYIAQLREQFGLMKGAPRSLDSDAQVLGGASP